MSNLGTMANVAPGMDMPQSAGAEAVEQSDVAKAGLEAWRRCLELNGQRPSGDDVKAILMYIMTEGPDAPEARNMIAWLQQKGIGIPGVTGDVEGEVDAY